MLHQKAPAWIVLPAVAVLAVFVAGFFHDGPEGRESSRSAPGPGLQRAADLLASAVNEDSRDAAAEYPPMGRASAAQRKVSFAVPANLYRRSGEVGCRVASVVKTYEDIDLRMKDFGGEIVEMEITGNDDGRRGVLRCTVSTHQFNPCITYLRGLGKVLSERITASSRPKSKSVVPPGDEDPDPRELSLVTIQMVDERASKEVSESSGLLATAFGRSASHGLAGLAVIVEGLGWVAPYALIVVMLVAPFMAARKFRRRAPVPAPQAA